MQQFEYIIKKKTRERKIANKSDTSIDFAVENCIWIILFGFLIFIFFNL